MKIVMSIYIEFIWINTQTIGGGGLSTWCLLPVVCCNEAIIRSLKRPASNVRRRMMFMLWWRGWFLFFIRVKSVVMPMGRGGGMGEEELQTPRSHHPSFFSVPGPFSLLYLVRQLFYIIFHCFHLFTFSSSSCSLPSLFSYYSFSL